jgi:hypothetical protein
MEPIHLLLALARGGVDQQATRRDEDGSGGNIGQGCLKSSPRVKTFFKVTGLKQLIELVATSDVFANLHERRGGRAN